MAQTSFARELTAAHDSPSPETPNEKFTTGVKWSSSISSVTWEHIPCGPHHQYGVWCDLGRRDDSEWIKIPKPCVVELRVKTNMRRASDNIISWSWTRANVASDSGLISLLYLNAICAMINTRAMRVWLVQPYSREHSTLPLSSRCKSNDDTTSRYSVKHVAVGGIVHSIVLHHQLSHSVFFSLGCIDVLVCYVLYIYFCLNPHAQ